MKKIIVGILLATCLPIFAQTKDETIQYILTEVPAVTPTNNGYQYIFSRDEKGRLWFVSKWRDIVDRNPHSNAIPIFAVEIYVDQSQYGYNLAANVRNGSNDAIQAYVNGVYTCSFNSGRIVGGSDNLPKLKKLEKAFNHLIELETGRKELF